MTAKLLRSRTGRRSPVVLFWAAVVLLAIAVASAVIVPAYLSTGEAREDAQTATRAEAEASTDLRNALSGVDVAREALTSGIEDGSIPTPIAVWAGAISMGDPLPANSPAQDGYSFAVGRISSAQGEVIAATAAHDAAAGHLAAAEAAEESAANEFLWKGAISAGVVSLFTLVLGTFVTLDMQRNRRSGLREHHVEPEAVA